MFKQYYMYRFTQEKNDKKVTGLSPSKVKFFKILLFYILLHSIEFARHYYQSLG